jgi:hypothetical protein
MGGSESEEHGDDGRSSAGSANGAILSVASPNAGQNCGVSPAFSIERRGGYWGDMGCAANLGDGKGWVVANPGDEPGGECGGAVGLFFSVPYADSILNWVKG